MNTVWTVTALCWAGAIAVGAFGGGFATGAAVTLRRVRRSRPARPPGRHSHQGVHGAGPREPSPLAGPAPVLRAPEPAPAPPAAGPRTQEMRAVGRPSPRSAALRAEPVCWCRDPLADHALEAPSPCTVRGCGCAEYRESMSPRRVPA